jgi:hypothetical protein
MHLTGLEPATYRLVAQFLSQLRYCMPLRIYLVFNERGLINQCETEYEPQSKLQGRL